MGRAFAEIGFTPAVKAEQARYGSRRAYGRLEGPTVDPQASLGDLETAFIAERDGFYQATVTESGWPYVQYRGGPPGFLRVLGASTVAYADFRGNMQYMSMGNLRNNHRIALILVDYAHQQRLKLWGHATVVHRKDAPDDVRALEQPGYHAHAERAVVITIAAFDWNCPQHITPRYTRDEALFLFAGGALAEA